jgi:hypothetical protein
MEKDIKQRQLPHIPVQVFQVFFRNPLYPSVFPVKMQYVKAQFGNTKLHKRHHKQSEDL